MAYQRPKDVLRQELRKDVAGTIVHWPLVDGANVQVSSTAGHNTWTVYTPAGVVVQGPTNIDGTLVDDIDRFDVPVSAIATLDEDYYVDLLWREAGATLIRRDVIVFDVVRYPFGGPLIALSHLLEERPDIGEVLDRHGQTWGYAAGDVARETAAAIYAGKAHVELDAMIRSQIASDVASIAQVATWPPPTGRTRPNLIINRERLRRVEAKIAMREIATADYRGESEEGSWMIRHYSDEVQRAWGSVGPLQYDADENLAPDSTIEEIGRVIIQRRTQG